MTVYVDDFRAPAKVGGIQARWSHLTADTPQELHEFAVGVLDMRRDWFQAAASTATARPKTACAGTSTTTSVDRRRRAAIAAGATAITYRQFGALISARKPQFQEEGK